MFLVTVVILKRKKEYIFPSRLLQTSTIYAVIIAPIPNLPAQEKDIFHHFFKKSPKDDGHKKEVITLVMSIRRA